MRIAIHILAILLFVATANAQTRLSLNNKWTLNRINDTLSVPATIPGTVHTDLWHAGRIPNPLAGCNEARLQWIGEVNWKYTSTVELTKEQINNQNIELVFDGIDTYAEVRLNGQLLEKTENMFRQYRFPAEKLLKVGTNNIEVIIFAGKAKEELQKQPIFLPGGEWAAIRKSPYHFGWDWGPRYITAGIWKPAYLEVWDKQKITNLHIETQSVDSQKANLSTIVSIISEKNQKASIAITVDGVQATAINAKLQKGENRVSIPISINQPQLWWSNGLGKQKLYNISASIKVKKTASTLATTYGIRTVELVQEPDSIGTSFFFKVNGQPVFMKGANIIPRHSFLPEASDTNLRQLITDAADAGMNMLRVWGGGAYEDDLFYHLCDSLGILVWQDFMFAGSMYPADPSFLENVKVEATQQIQRLRNHPCIALWCGNNEVSEAWHNWGWQKQNKISPSDSAKIWQGYLSLFENLLPSLVAKEDSARAYWPSSPLNGWGRTKSMTEGDSHYWGVWWGKQPFDVYTEKVPRIMSEYGFQGFPYPETVKRFTSTEDGTPDSTELKCHQRHPIGYEIIDEYLDRENLHPKSLLDKIYQSQLLQAKGMGMAMEAHRRAKPFCMGSLFWQLNDCWPVVSWSAIDFYGNPKAVYYTAKHAFADVLISSVEKEGELEVWVVSDRQSSFDATLSAKVITFFGETVAEEELLLHIDANSSTKIDFPEIVTTLKELNPKKHMVVLAMEDASGKQYLATHYFAPLGDLSLPATEPIMQVAERNGKKVLTLSSGIVVKNLFVWFSGIDARLDENFVDIIPGAPLTVEIHTKASVGELTATIKAQWLN
ncbi:beta-mannosidase [Williamwhitmania taraxaci]|uniref:Beta-mannosidase B n=1 Tax=Williamwhitmania taraxaci TaxID=1640674 RepID=A0A1G6NLX2_9BACT|nr:glycoside hydrolase family 2 protein [Williamwhitmania taraxaci]SDC68883.1 beta-mannosidase [Williamwhitmania taraxaci]